MSPQPNTTFADDAAEFLLSEWAEVLHAPDPETRAMEELAIIGLIGEIERREVQLAVASSALDALKESHADPIPEVFDLLREFQFDAKPLIEVKQDELDKFTMDRILGGKNPAIVIRKGNYYSLRSLLDQIGQLSGTDVADRERFPKPGNGLGHSRIHLDNFIEPDGSHFRDTLSVSAVNKGKVLFIAGLASPAVYGWSEHPEHSGPYDDALRTVNKSKQVAGFEERATDPVNPRGVGYSEWEPRTRAVKGSMIATTLNEGDIAIWPQGAEGSQLPAWHGFLQIGHRGRPDFEARQSTSFHFR